MKPFVDVIATANSKNTMQSDGAISSSSMRKRSKCARAYFLTVEEEMMMDSMVSSLYLLQNSNCTSTTWQQDSGLWLQLTWYIDSRNQNEFFSFTRFYVFRRTKMKQVRTLLLVRVMYGNRIHLQLINFVIIWDNSAVSEGHFYYVIAVLIRR